VRARRCRHHDEVERPAQVERRQVRLDPRDRRLPTTSRLEHRAVDVDPDHLDPRRASSIATRPVPQPASSTVVGS
jgi:hypothetical protein